MNILSWNQYVAVQIPVALKKLSAMTFQPAAHGAVFCVLFCFFFLHAREYAANCNAIVRMHVWNQRSDQEQHEFFFFFFFLPNTLSSLLEPCLAVILKKVNLEQMVVAAHGFNVFFFLFFFISLIFFFYFFVWEYCDSSFSVAWITSIKETVGREKRNIQLILHCVMNKI